MNGGNCAPARPDFYRTGCFSNYDALVGRLAPEVDRVLIVFVDDARKWKAELIFLARQLDTVFLPWHFLAVAIQPREPS
ncbi:MAG: hypothetical protein JWL62_3488 [Hyphomicrobiales bacterium]|nr:hypothetical protein [Hyphomicrobiales bacterium]